MQRRGIPVVQAHTLGPARLLVDGQPVTLAWQHAAEILWYLPAHPDGASSAELGAAIWPECLDADKRQAVRSAIHALRQSLPPGMIASPLHGQYRIDRSAIQLDYDIERFSALK